MSKDLTLLSSHLSTLIEARTVSQHELDPLVAYAIQTTQDGRSEDTRRAQWEYLLKNEVFKLAATEGDALKEKDTRYFDELKSRLDLVLAFTEHNVCDASFPFSVLEDLLETQTVASCWYIFSWIEERTERLTTNMVPAKGKSLVLLRTLNDLLRRLSKTGKSTMFCGRILNFLSSVFSLGERSGVNLRGDYGPQWEGVSGRKKEGVVVAVAVEGNKDKDKDVEMRDGEKDKDTKEVTAAKSPSSEKTEEEKKDEFYQTFWSLQLPFSRPPLFAHTITFESFKESVNAVLPVIAEATKKERAMMGSKVVAGNLKRKREPTPQEVSDDSSRDYFFAKFLTSPDLLDLEIADTLFRRQFLFQLLILLQHLLHFTQSEKAKWAVQRNRSLHMDFTLNTSDAKWAQDTWTKAMEELKATTPNGKAFADTVAVVLERERNWIKWKNDLCPPFDKEPIQPPLEEQTREKRQKMMDPTPAWRYNWGTEALTELWESGFHGLRDCEDPPGPGELKDFAKRIKQTEMRIEMRKKQLARMAPAPVPPPSTVSPSAEAGAKSTASQELPSSQSSQTSAPALTTGSQPATTPAAPIPVIAPPTGPASLHPSLPPRPGASPASFAKNQTPIRPQPSQAQAPPAPAPTPTPKAAPAPTPKQDPQLINLTEQKDRFSWLALRRARMEHLHLFGRIGTGDVELLMTTIEQEKQKEKEKVEKAEAPMQPIPASQPIPTTATSPNRSSGQGEGSSETPRIEMEVKVAEGASVSATSGPNGASLPQTDTGAMEVDASR